MHARKWLSNSSTLLSVIPQNDRKAEIKLFKETQSSYFPEEYESLKHEKALSSSSNLLGLQPKLDNDGLMRLDSRLKHAKFLSYDARYPVILPRKSLVTKLIVKEFHKKDITPQGPTKHCQLYQLGIGLCLHVRLYGSWKRHVQNVADIKQGL